MTTRLCLLVMLAGTLSYAADRQDVSILAYVNVSSGCQQNTVDFLNQLKAKYAPNVKLEMVDFGDGGKGTRRWQESGHRCMTIELNGMSMVKYPYQGKTQVRAFRQPAGFIWSHADLEHAVQAGLTGQLAAATEAEVEAAFVAAPVTNSVLVTNTRVQGKAQSLIKLNGFPVMRLYGQDASTRANNVAQTLRAWLMGKYSRGALTIKQNGSGWAVMTGSTKLITATAADAKAAGTSAKALAESWRKNVASSLK